MSAPELGLIPGCMAEVTAKGNGEEERYGAWAAWRQVKCEGCKVNRDAAAIGGTKEESIVNVEEKLKPILREVCRSPFR